MKKMLIYSGLMFAAVLATEQNPNEVIGDYLSEENNEFLESVSVPVPTVCEMVDDYGRSFCESLPDQKMPPQQPRIPLPSEK